MTALAMIDGLDPQTPVSTVVHLVSGVSLVFDVMSSGEWMTIFEVRESVSKLPEGKFFSESCISARIRDQRKAKHGANIVNRRMRKGTINLYEYQLLVDTTPEAA